MKMPYYKNRNSLYKEKMVSWPSNLYDGYTYTCKDGHVKWDPVMLVVEYNLLHTNYIFIFICFALTVIWFNQNLSVCFCVVFVEFTKFKMFSLYLFGLCCVGFFCLRIAIIIIFWQCKLCPFMIYHPGTSIYKLHSTSRLRSLQDFASSNIWGLSVFVLDKQCQSLKSAAISHDLHEQLVW